MELEPSKVSEADGRGQLTPMYLRCQVQARLCSTVLSTHYATAEKGRC